jgi:mRNA degradation ribonuclease J1/J2
MAAQEPHDTIAILFTFFKALKTSSKGFFVVIVVIDGRIIEIIKNLFFQNKGEIKNRKSLIEKVKKVLLLHQLD